MKTLHAAALALVLSGAAASAAWAQQDDSSKVFLEKAMKGDNSEIMLGTLAADRGASQGIRHYGEVLRDDHTQAREQVLPLAQQMGVPATDAPMAEATQERTRLEDLHGRAFDHEFARYMVQDHEHDIADFQREARKSGPVAQLARQTLPVLRKHLAMAQRLSRS